MVGASYDGERMIFLLKIREYSHYSTSTMLGQPSAADCSQAEGKFIKIWKRDTRGKVQPLLSDEN